MKLNKMKYNARLKTLFYLWMAGLLFGMTACKKDKNDDNPGQDTVQSELQNMADQVLTDYTTMYPEYPGGLAVQVIYKENSWFVTSGLASGTTNGIHFRAASNTKTFTSTAILLLHQQGKLNVNARIIDTIPGTDIPYVPDNSDFTIPYKDQITILQLLQHKAGVFDVSNEIIPDTVSAEVPYKGANYLEWVMEQDYTHTFTFDELVAVNALCGLFYFEPATGYHYSNTGYSILGKIIERVSGMSYSDFVTTHIIHTMNLTHSSMPWMGTDLQIPEPFAPGYIIMPEEINCTESNISGNVAEGNLITTPYDLAHFLRSLIRGEGVLSTATVNDLMLTPLIPPDTVTKYTCGISYTDNLGYGHNGAHEGYLSLMATDPETDYTVVVFTNTWNIEKGLMPGIVEQIKLLLHESAFGAKEIVQ
ncbi:MAG: serine hydrolase domain-containing protein [Bacteroidota bacterium]|nr:serine hydrolase domain-containing protein [Bacteroidota bacterium]